MSNSIAVSFINGPKNIGHAVRNWYERGLRWVLRPSTVRSERRHRHAGCDDPCSTSSCPRVFFPQQDTGVIIGVTDAARKHFLQSDDGTRARGFRYREKGSRCGERFRVGGRGHGQRHHQHCAPLHCAQTAQSTRQRRSRSSIVCATRRGMSKAFRFSCKLRRTCRSTARVSRTQFQYILQDADAAELARMDAKTCCKNSDSLPQLTDVASDQQINGLATQCRC